MACCLFIPTYWSTETLQSWKVFDHPSSITEEGTLGRTLDNLQHIGFSDHIMVLPAPCTPEISQKVETICHAYDLPVTVCTPDLLVSLTNALGKAGLSVNDRVLIGSDSYGGVRNIGLAYAALHGYDQIIMIDDDECISPDYKARALAHIGERYKGKMILGKDGCVEDKNGRKTYDGQKGPWGSQWPKDELFNAQIQQYLDARESIMESTLGFGGNMVIDQRLFANVPFDPFVNRGEDDDYLLNCSYRGFSFFFDKDLVLLHLPPERAKAFWSRQRQDIVRFLYVREKLRLMGIPRESLGGFMEYFTGPDLERKAVCSSIDAAQRFMDTDHFECNGFMENAKAAVCADAGKLKANSEAFLRLMDVWRGVMTTICGGTE